MPAQAYITASNAADLVFQLRLRNGLTEVQLSKIPEELRGELESPRFLRVTEVGSQKATLAMYSSRASAMTGGGDSGIGTYTWYTFFKRPR